MTSTGVTVSNIDPIFESKPTPRTFDRLRFAKYGFSVDIIGDKVYVGAPGDDRAAVYDLNTANYSQWTAFVGPENSQSTYSGVLRPAYTNDAPNTDLGEYIVANSSGLSSEFFAGQPLTPTRGGLASTPTAADRGR